MSKKRVLLVNPNSNEATTQMMCRLAQAELPEFEVVGATAAGGPRMIVEETALRQSRRYVVAAALRVLQEDAGIAGLMVAAYGDPGRDILEDLLDIPVVGIGRASILAASAGGRTFGIATSTPGLVPPINAMVESARGSARFVGVCVTRSEPTVLAADPERQFEELRDAVQECVGKGAEAVIIGGGPLSETARRLAELGIGVIVEPVPSACALLRKELMS
ncbi:aspartate/glutamate racemase family protein [Pseudorhodoferax sp.]|uniref:aspartate/glutamate racemase family protein n=1 Tax=Pseudorhodoferax sp. TaxID=1993553 RepID=UPI0039E31241